jgi:truncated hemoglobin YjbI
MIQHDASEERIKAYKALLTHIIDGRPAGTRQRLADALGKHRSFITQITSSFYTTPLPERHLATIFSVCQFSDEEQRSFLDAYDAAHPKRPKHKQDFRNMRQLSVLVPDLGEAAANRKFDEAVAEFALRMGALFAENGSAHTNGAKPPVKPKRH